MFVLAAWFTLPVSRKHARAHAYNSSLFSVESEESHLPHRDNGSQGKQGLVRATMN